MLTPLEAMVESVIIQRGKTKTFLPLSHKQHNSIPFNPRGTPYKERETSTDSLPDTKAQVVIAGMQLVKELGLVGLSRPCSMILQAAKKMTLESLVE